MGWHTVYAMPTPQAHREEVGHTPRCLQAAWWCAFVNSFIHTLMYYYYMVTVLGIQPWWKKWMTTMQLIQVSQKPGPSCVFVCAHPAPPPSFSLSLSVCVWGGGGVWHKALVVGVGAVKRPRQQPAHPQYANYWAPLTRKRHTMPHSAQSQHANYWAPRTRKRHQQEHRPQRPTESSDPTQHAKGRTGDRPGPRKGATTRRNVTQGGVEEQGTWASRTRRHREAGYARPVDRGAWTAKTVKRPQQQPAQPQYANCWAPLTRKRHTMPHPTDSTAVLSN